jgi:uncharacterized protein (DUF433 family)
MKLPDFLTEDADGFIHVTGRRVGLVQLVHYYSEGYSAEMLAAEFASVPLSVVHKILGFYLENQEEIDEYVARSRQQIEEQRSNVPGGPGLQELRRRLASRRRAQGA